MNQNLWAGGYVQMDLTTIRFLGQKTKSGAAATGQMWVATVPGGEVVYYWRLTNQPQHCGSILAQSFFLAHAPACPRCPTLSRKARFGSVERLPLIDR